jgi:SPX domain protein involved in polyphosphate accumulation
MLRYEYKYFAPYELLGRLRSMIKPFMELDSYAQEHGGEYTVRSIYFDTSDMECYAQKIAGVKRRNKVRLRGYNGGNAESEVFFEIKEKVDEPLFKRRSSLSYEEAQEVLLGKSLDEVVFASGKSLKASEEAGEEARRFLYHLHARRMRPVLTVIYEREPYQAIFFDKENDLRITLDKNLRAVAWPSLDALFEERHPYPVESQRFIMEIKFNRYLPNWVKAVITSLGLTRTSASKYALCVEAHPEMSTGWRR